MSASPGAFVHLNVEMESVPQQVPWGQLRQRVTNAAPWEEPQRPGRPLLRMEDLISQSHRQEHVGIDPTAL